MKKGGYQIIDLQNKPFALDVKYEIKGIYDLIEGTRKPLYFTGIYWNDKEYHDTIITMHTEEGVYVGIIIPDDYSGDKVKITISDNDVVEMIGA